jgi:hypothetical protein
MIECNATRARARGLRCVCPRFTRSRTARVGGRGHSMKAPPLTHHPHRKHPYSRITRAALRVRAAPMDRERWCKPHRKIEGFRRSVLRPAQSMVFSNPPHPSPNTVCVVQPQCHSLFTCRRPTDRVHHASPCLGWPSRRGGQPKGGGLLEEPLDLVVPGFPRFDTC